MLKLGREAIRTSNSSARTTASAHSRWPHTKRHAHSARAALDAALTDAGALSAANAVRDALAGSDMCCSEVEHRIQMLEDAQIPSRARRS